MSDRPVDPGWGGGREVESSTSVITQVCFAFFFFSPFDTEMNEDILPALKDRQIDR